ncbi:hypothetical protein [Sphingobacterium sp. SYP-B4668]|uniref:hypothetical protein n=1 Tax=Sphingobacterium sp. SYP-B4668 TaxID=2996035 RepID=UPI0022DD5616|nr:hypothetical protein [Sphingobacterium sp. SYP-B4668]
MKTKIERIHVLLTVPRSIVDAAEYPYFHERGLSMEDSVKEQEVKNGIDASFDGFEILSATEQLEHVAPIPDEDTVTAKLYYYVTTVQK